MKLKRLLLLVGLLLLPVIVDGQNCPNPFASIIITAPPFNAVNSAARPTCTATGGNQTISCSTSITDFLAGQTISLKGVGPVNALVAPTPTVTTIGSTGSQTLAYEIACIDQNLGISAVGTSAQVTNALSTTMEASQNNTTMLQWTCGAAATYSCIYKNINSAGWVATYAVAGGGSKIFFDFNQDQLMGVNRTNTNQLCVATPPAAPTNGDLLTTILPGGAAGTLKLAAAPAISSAPNAAILDHDNTAAIQLALSSATIGQQVYIPGGTFDIHNTLFLMGGQSIFGDNSAWGIPTIGSLIRGTKGADVFAIPVPQGQNGGALQISYIQVQGGNNQFHDYGTNGCTPAVSPVGAPTNYCGAAQKVWMNNVTGGGGYDGMLWEDDGAPTQWHLMHFSFQGENGVAMQAMPSMGQGVGFMFEDGYLGGIDGQNFVQYYQGNIYETNVNSNSSRQYQLYNWGAAFGLGSEMHNMQGEDNGNAQPDNRTIQTTGTIASGSNSLVIVNATGLQVDDQIVVEQAGTQGNDLGNMAVPVYACAISGTTVTLTLDKHAVDSGCTLVANASTAHCASGGCRVTNALYSAFTFAPGGPSGGTISIYGGSLSGNQRYAIDASGVGTLYLFNVCGAHGIYAPAGAVGGLPNCAVYRSPDIGPGQVFTQDASMTNLPSPTNANLNLTLVGGGGGGTASPFGKWCFNLFHSTACAYSIDSGGVTYSSAHISALSGTTAGTVRWSQDAQGASFKRMTLNFVAYENTSGTSQTITFPTAYNSSAPGIICNAAPGGGTAVTANATVVTLPKTMSTTFTGECEVEGE